MSNRYVRVPNQPERRSQEIDDEVQAAFDYREEDDDDHDSSESRPLNRNARPDISQAHTPPPIQPAPYNQQGSYNFDSVDYDFPPPGSPPPLSAIAFPNEIGNNNGYVPVFDGRSVPAPQQPWWKRAASTVLPQSARDRLGLGVARPAGPVGGGLNNDGVFANVVAKPAPPVRIQNGDEVYVVPEDSQAAPPPSYAQAQADAVPPYWETTVHAPFAPDSMGEMIVDSLPTGSLFSFCWNMLVSISFQFVGFLLTYLLHTSHAARLGSRAGLGVTLIQYGFALRGRLDSADGSNGEQSPWGSDWPTPTATGFPQAVPTPMPMGTDTDPSGFYGLQPGNNTGFGMTEEQAAFLADATTEWLSFFLMTIGWFVLLTSLLGFYRVKRWEKGILASQQASQPRDVPAQTPGSAPMFTSNLDQTFALNGMSRIELLRQGFGFNRSQRTDDGSDVAEAGIAGVPLDPNNPADRRAIQIVEQDSRLRDNLRAAGFL